MSLFDWANGHVFRLVHGNNLVYNACWEDPRLDREALQVTSDDTMLVITSAGCNALDYALDSPAKIFAVDVNPRQNALLELKLAAIRNLDFEDFFAMFGRGRIARAAEIYHDKLRTPLSDWARGYWDRYIGFFDAKSRRPFYFRGTSGAFAMLINFYIDRIVRLRPEINELLAAPTIARQRHIYERKLRDRFWSASLRFVIRQDAMLSMLGVPRAQRNQIEKQYEGGIAQFIRDCLESVFTKIPLADNYFWRVYMTGEYTPECCPEYLKPHNFERLRAGLADRIEVHTDTVEGVLKKSDRPISRFVLLDHMDWLSEHHFASLESEWQWIVRRAAPGARAIWRSAGLRTDFVDRAQIVVGGQNRQVGELLTYHREMASWLHPKCRVHTYGSFHIADLAT